MPSPLGGASSTSSVRSEPGSAPRVLVRTQRLGHNYGGLLQAYALQTAIRELGYEVDTDRTQPPTRIGQVARLVWPLKERLTSKPIVMHEVINQADRHLLAFRDAKLSTVALYGARRAPRSSLVRNYSGFIVGSDQIWRPRYSNIPSSLLDFLPATFPGPRFSYAASFGTDSADEFVGSMAEDTRDLAMRLDAISVREASGIGLVEELWGRPDAQQHVDPTMLLEPHQYDSLIDSASSQRGWSPPTQEGSVVAYILDPSASVSHLSAKIADQLGVPLNSTLRPDPPNRQCYARDPLKFTKMSVEEWLWSIQHASFVVTDSFHGCVFSILFRRPFVVLPNRDRGLARFDTLLELLGLEDRAVVAGSPNLNSAQRKPIDWDTVQLTIDRERSRSLTYLRTRLSRIPTQPS